VQTRKEQAVLLTTVIVLGLLVQRKLGKTELRGSRRTSPPSEFEPVPVPDLSACLPVSTTAGRSKLGRDLFSAPRDTAPLAYLDLELPPLEKLAGLAPPTAFGPGAAYFGKYLRQPVDVERVDGLFELDAAPDDDFLSDGDLLSESATDLTRAEREGTLSGAGHRATSDRSSRGTLTSEERSERTAAYKRLYDWIHVGSLRFGHIKNADRYGLAARPEEAIAFAEVDPSTGQARFGGQNAIEYERGRVSEFGFANTEANAIEIGRREFGEQLSPAQLDRALAFAERCVRVRLDAPLALEVAEEMYRLAIEVSDGDPRPELGLAWCFEVGFRFEQAFEVYDRLIAGGHDKNPLVLARRADLLARFRMFERADLAYLDALRWGRTDWLVLWRYGRFLLERGRIPEAVETLAKACKFEPSTAETKALRAALRADHARARFEAGEPALALDWFQRASNAEMGYGLASAGMVSAQLYAGGQADDNLDGVLDTELQGASFDLLLALGLAHLNARDWASAKANLELAAEADPFRAYQAWRALSWLAELTDHPEEAAQYIELAYANAPDDLYTLYQRGRLLVQADDLEQAVKSFEGALDLELGLGDALVAIGEVARRTGEFEAAERYFERSLDLDPQRPLVHSLRGFSLLQDGDATRAEASFREALRLDGRLASAASGLAWCVYLSGDSGEATTQFADLVERRRGEAEDDPAKVHAEAQIKRIGEHDAKEVWIDGFERRAGERIGKGWFKEEPHGLLISLKEGAMVIEGQARSAGRTRVYQEIPAGQFVSFEALVTIEAGTRARTGLFLARELRRRGEWETQALVSISREKEGAVQARNIAQGERDAPYMDLFTTEWNTADVMRVKVELIGEGSEALATLYVDGLPVSEGMRVPRLGSATANLRFGILVDTESGRSAQVSIDDVSVVRRIH